MPRFIFLPDPSRSSMSFGLADGRRVRSGDVFDVTGADEAVVAQVNRTCLGRPAPGTTERQPAIITVEASNTRVVEVRVPVPADGPSFDGLKRVLGLPPSAGPADAFAAVRLMRSGIDALAARVGLPDGAPVEDVVPRVVARLEARPVEAVLESFDGPPALALDHDIPSNPQPGTVTGPPLIGPGAAIPLGVTRGEIDAAVATLTEPRRQYDEADLPETNAGLEKLAADNGVVLKAADKRSRSALVSAMRSAGLVTAVEG